MLTKSQEDALKEFINIAIGDAASLLSEMVNKKVQLSIPEVKLIDLEENCGLDKQLLPQALQGHVVSSSIRFGTQFNGQAQLVFPADKSKLLVAMCLGEEDIDSVSADELTDADFDVIREIGNVILNAVVGGLGNLLEVKIEYDLPEVNLLSLLEIEEEVDFAEDNYLLIIHNDFVVEETTVKGSVLVMMSIYSISYLLNQINQIVDDIYAE
ncbi:chemotaxis protein CheC [Fuchsiella alkaliacetigena]|uniref:chemotaxis protein CheC n=1 Tax=Fuchsiella alkaliacetigena TaxID=957042 RepID=UPI00200B1D2D|nr:chemotaxis protein CheC [Fuchsiella alkaliacetigena]MCK8826060.1 chemotaxis protein CheC [Fuchsiella alkaliacetigena]